MLDLEIVIKSIKVHINDITIKKAALPISTLSNNKG